MLSYFTSPKVPLPQLKYIICTFLIFININSIRAQQSVDKLDKQFKPKRNELMKLQSGSKGDFLLVYAFKSNKKIFFVMKRKYYGKQGHDSVVAYQFGYINDTLLRVWYASSSYNLKFNGSTTVYVKGDNVVAKKLYGKIQIPDVNIIKNKSKELFDLGNKLIENKVYDNH